MLGRIAIRTGRMPQTLTLTARTVLVLGIALLILGGTVLYAERLLAEVDETYSATLEDVAAGQMAAADGTRAVLRAQREIYRALLQADRPDQARQRLAASREAAALVQTTVGEAAQRLRLGSETAAVLAVRQELLGLATEAETLIAAGRGAEARATVGAKLDALTTRSRLATDAMTTVSRAHADAENTRLSAEVAALRRTLLVALAMALLAGIGLAWWLLQHGAARPLRALAELARALAAGDLDRPVPAADRRDEVGRIAAGLASLRDAALR
ncbi:hypothetical protein CKO45_28625, partial [Paracraurococcus ruber]|nr:hypothetical protein [Paracraurococcus ruber]